MVTNRYRKSFESHRKKFQRCSDYWHRWRFWSAFGHFGTHFAESFRMAKYSWIMEPTRSREIPSCPAIDLAEIRRSSKNSSWIWAINSWVVTVLGRPGRGVSRVEKSPRLNWAIQVLTVANDGAFSLMFLSEWHEFSSAPCLARKNLTARVSMLLKSCASPDMLPFSPCNEKSLAIRHMRNPLFPTTLSIPYYDFGI